MVFCRFSVQSIETVSILRRCCQFHCARCNRQWSGGRSASSACPMKLGTSALCGMPQWMFTLWMSLSRHKPSQWPTTMAMSYKGFGQKLMQGCVSHFILFLSVPVSPGFSQGLAVLMVRVLRCVFGYVWVCLGAPPRWWCLGERYWLSFERDAWGKVCSQSLLTGRQCCWALTCVLLCHCVHHKENIVFIRSVAWPCTIAKSCFSTLPKQSWQRLIHPRNRWH